MSLGRWFRREVTIEPGQRLVRRGPYRVLRHPSYTGLVLIFAGFGLAIGSWVGAAAALVLVLAGMLPRIRVEESALANSVRRGVHGVRELEGAPGPTRLVGASTIARMPRFVDLSAPIAPSPEGTPEFLATRIDYFAHAAGAAEIEALFGVPPRLLRDGEGWAVETITHLGTHNSTHVDAPYHYNSTIRGEPAQTIDQLPLEWFFAPGVVLDFTGRDDGDAVRAEELEPALAAAGHELRERDIVLVRTDCDRFYAEPDYMFRGPGVTAEATEWLFDRGVRVMGIDAWGWDRPLNLQAAEAVERDEPGVFWAAHQATSRTRRSSGCSTWRRYRRRASRSRASR